MGTLMERKLKAFPEIETVVTKTGRAEISEAAAGESFGSRAALARFSTSRVWTRRAISA